LDVERLQRLSRQILADVLSVGSVLTAGPVWSATHEGRLHALLQHHGHETDAEVAARFRQAHPELFQGPPQGGGKPGG